MNSGQSNLPGDGQPDGRDLWRILQDDSEPTDGDLPSEDEAESAAPETPVESDSHEQAASSAADSKLSHGGVTRIERILSDPESLETEVDFREVVEQTDEDFDAAVLSFYRDTDAAVTCKNHPKTPAADQCPECQAYFCQECLVVRRGRLLCRDCATALYVPSEEEILAAQEYGISTVGTDVAPEEHPEFQVTGSMLGLEGRPAHPFKRLVALLIDMLLTRGLVLLLAWIAGGLLSSQPGVFYHLFDTQPDSAVIQRVFNAVVLMRPVMPWLIVFTMVDFLYFFLCLSFTNRTLGMSWLGCRVVTEWGDFAGFGVIALRTLVFMVCLGWPSILIGWFFPAFRGPHDYAAGTVVINYSGNKRVDSYDTVQIKLD